jgi:predicted HicB family RNase H-like nuclease
MTNSQNTDLSNADSNGHFQERIRFRVEVSPDIHQTLRETALQQGKYIKVIVEEILQAHFEQQSGDGGAEEPNEEAPKR